MFGSGGSFLAIEPQKNNFQLLQSNIAVNHLINMSVHKAAVGNTEVTDWGLWAFCAWRCKSAWWTLSRPRASSIRIMGISVWCMNAQERPLTAKTWWETLWAVNSRRSCDYLPMSWRTWWIFARRQPGPASRRLNNQQSLFLWSKQFWFWPSMPPVRNATGRLASADSG